ncbi:MAG: hypothetical protein LBS74_00925 [Oscillospiraceae bacterium]|jgi:hypothetical protein|nr:hypothetical protein [Oscillospiraceae bacterium]
MNKKTKITIVAIVGVIALIPIIVWVCGKSLNIKPDGIASIIIGAGYQVELDSDEDIKACLKLINSIKFYPSDVIEASEPAVIIYIYDNKGNIINDIEIWDSDKFGYTVGEGADNGWYRVSPFELNKIDKFCEKYAKDEA